MGEEGRREARMFLFLWYKTKHKFSYHLDLTVIIQEIF